jgi:metal-responsive CopG/Arc/MetJ family transcriptional regulator
MKKKISITLSSNVLARVDRLAGSKRLRSAVIERAIRSALRQQSIAVTEVDELELINNAADRLNVEAADVLEYVSAFCSD